METVLGNGSACKATKCASRRQLRQWIREGERSGDNLFALRQWLVNLFERVGYSATGTFTLPKPLQRYYDIVSPHIDLNEGYFETIVRDIVEEERMARALASG